MRPFFNELISVTYTDRPTPIRGLVIDYNDEWTLLKSNPVDYAVDGYMIIRHKNVLGFQQGEDEKFVENVIKLKGVAITDKDVIAIDSLENILTVLSKNYELFQLELKSEKACYIGKLKSIIGKELIIHTVTPKGEWDNEMKFRTGDIRIIEYDTDYINSLKLLLMNG